jgi:hypothetical protein
MEEILICYRFSGITIADKTFIRTSFLAVLFKLQPIFQKTINIILPSVLWRIKWLFKWSFRVNGDVKFIPIHTTYAANLIRPDLTAVDLTK